ncbi:MAG: GNAT family N-acetyltransferase [Acidobacteriota bacterium]|nr:GNAT family N-acetyltransferase [Acidobacteriota bacterium]
MKPDEVEIRPFRPGDGEAFRLLNEAWIERHFGIEQKDRETLGEPNRNILAKGGHIFMATNGQKALGCIALLSVRPGIFEVAKMTVAESQRGCGLGRKLLAHAIAQGRALGADSVYLETNDQLKDAIHLYEELGFRHLPPERLTPSPYARANVFMELIFEHGRS